MKEIVNGSLGKYLNKYGKRLRSTHIFVNLYIYRQAAILQTATSPAIGVKGGEGQVLSRPH